MREWLHFLLLPLAGVSLAQVTASSAVRLGGATVVASLLWAGVYLVNSFSDIGIDGRSKNALVRAGPAALNLAGATVPVLLVGACGAALLVGVVPAVAALVTAGVGVVYSVGPRLKRLPVLGTLSNVAIFAPGLFLGATDGDSVARAWGLAIPFAVLLIQNQLVHEVADADDDAEGRLLTTYRWSGRAGVAALLGLSGVGGAIALLMRSSGVPSIALLLLLPIPALLFVAWTDARALAARCRALHRRYALVVGALFWLAAGPSP